MTTIAILQEAAAGGSILYRAVARRKESVGRTVGEALDALTSQLSEEEAGTLVIVQNFRPDHYFTARQQQRLSELMARWRQARDGGSCLSAPEQAELESLIEAELEAARKRTEAALDNVGQ
jgi:K+-transporting ATPase c subunit